MNETKKSESLRHDHSISSIRERLSNQSTPSYLGDFILGAIDGLVTTFAIISGVAGAKFDISIALILGVANLLADGFSMAVSNYFRAKSDHDILEEARATEERHIELVPEGEKEEIREIFRKKGFKGAMLDGIVQTVTSDKKLWIDTMLTEELGLRLSNPLPLKAALTTFGSFCLVGVVPVLPFIISIFGTIPHIYIISASMTFTSFFLLGFYKGHLLHQKRLSMGLETLFLGGGAALIAYFVGRALQLLLL
ncbi:MAG: VIT1/CCC1 transporter family protein [Deltaproteobacteria bacterium]|nr:VIT1/CCC1 transporter family protein [Deltaproteobacteria bacterium]